MIARLDVHGDDFRRKSRSKFERLLGDLAPVLDGHHNDGMRGLVGGDDGPGATRFDADHVVVAAHDAEKENQEGNEDDGDPGAFGKFCDQHDDDGDAGDESTKSVNESAL